MQLRDIQTELALIAQNLEGIRDHGDRAPATVTWQFDQTAKDVAKMARLLDKIIIEQSRRHANLSANLEALLEVDTKDLVNNPPPIPGAHYIR